MTGFELRITGVRSNRSTNTATPLPKEEENLIIDWQIKSH